MQKRRYIASQPTDVFCVSRVAVLVVCFRQSYAHRIFLFVRRKQPYLLELSFLNSLAETSFQSDDRIAHSNRTWSLDVLLLVVQYSHLKLDPKQNLHAFIKLHHCITKSALQLRRMFRSSFPLHLGTIR